MISKNGIQRNLSILGGEPLCDQNLAFTSDLIIKVKEKYSNIKIFVWTGYSFEDLIGLMNTNHNVKLIIGNTDIIVDGKFVKELRDISLPLRGSTNQRIIDVKNSLKEGQAVLYKW